MITLDFVIIISQKLILGREWDIILYENRTTCFISTPFNVDKKSNLMTISSISLSRWVIDPFLIPVAGEVPIPSNCILFFA